nr:PD-(D/E)XK nuclease family transposase [uncultured Anaerostipes sp.]
MEAMADVNHKKIDNKLDARYEKYKGILKNLTMMNDVFMRNVFKKQECTEYVLQVIMGRKDLKVLDQVLQKDYKNLQGRSAILDCVVRDADGKQFDVEIQQDTEGASPKRARYHSGLMDMNTLDAGQDFDELPETYLIFITRDDVLGHDLPIYHIKRKIEEVQEDFKDEAYIMYVNSRRQDDTELGQLMQDFHCKNAEDIHSEVLAQRVHELKENQEGVDFMSREMDEIYNEGAKCGAMEKAKETALILADRGMSVSDIADIVKVNVKLVQEWLSGNRSLVK